MINEFELRNEKEESNISNTKKKVENQEE